MKLSFVTLAAAVAALTLTATATPANTSAQHYGPPPAAWHAPSWWLPQALCIHSHEGAMPDNTGNSYFSGWQFLESTWTSVGGADYPAFRHPGGWHPRDVAHPSGPWSSSADGKLWPFPASPREQLWRVWLVYTRDGNSWREWGTRGYCGL